MYRNFLRPCYGDGYKVTIDTIMKNCKTSKAILLHNMHILLNANIPANSTQREVKVYSGRHYNTDRSVFKKFSKKQESKLAYRSCRDNLNWKIKREGKNSQADLILLVDAARITNASEAGFLQSIQS